MVHTAPLDSILSVLNPTPEQRMLQHARRLEIAREQGDIDAAMVYFHLMQRLYHEHFKTTVAGGRKVHGFLSADADTGG